MKISFRKATPIDLPALLGLARRCIEAMRSSGIEQWDEIYPDAGTFERDIALQTLHVCEADGQLAGCVTLNDFQDPGYATISWQMHESPIAIVHRLMICPTFQGRGLARQLMSYTETVAREEGFRTIRLDAFTQNPAALALYEKGGYRRVGLVQFRKGPFWCFEKTL